LVKPNESSIRLPSKRLRIMFLADSARSAGAAEGPFPPTASQWWERGDRIC